MSYPKLFGIITVALFGTIIVLSLFKGKKEKPRAQEKAQEALVVLQEEVPLELASTSETVGATSADIQPALSDAALPEANRIGELFNLDGPKLPIVETITYHSRVPWQKGRPAWLTDYASHYQTSRHFIARSLNGSPDYFKQDLAEGDRFNVLRQDKNTQFYLLVDLSRCKMWFYYDDLDTKERVLIKTYAVGLGRLDSSKTSGLLTPIGKYTLGNKIAIYKPKTMGYYNNERIEMITVFGSRWIPFDKELGNCSAPAKGLGLHGMPWVATAREGTHEDGSSLGNFQSDGCVRLATADIEELFSIVITKPTVVELVRDFHDATPVTPLLVANQ